MNGPLPRQNAKGDRILETIERGEHWFTSNRILIAVVIGVFFVAIFISQGIREKGNQDQEQWWTEASKLTTPEQREEFARNNPQANASVLLSLQAARAFLDQGKFERAESICTNFLQINSAHPYAEMAYLLRAYAREELGHQDLARKDYEMASAKGKLGETFSESAISRLN